MTEYLMFHQALLGSLEHAKGGYLTANQIDITHGCRDFPYNDLYEAIANYVVADEPKPTLRLNDLGMGEFIANFLERAYDQDLPSAESMLGESGSELAPDFAKKTFLLVMAHSILEKI